MGILTAICRSDDDHTTDFAWASNNMHS